MKIWFEIILQYGKPSSPNGFVGDPAVLLDSRQRHAGMTEFGMWKINNDLILAIASVITTISAQIRVNKPKCDVFIACPCHCWCHQTLLAKQPAGPDRPRWGRPFGDGFAAATETNQLRAVAVVTAIKAAFWL